MKLYKENELQIGGFYEDVEGIYKYVGKSNNQLFVFIEMLIDPNDENNFIENGRVFKTSRELRFY